MVHQLVRVSLVVERDFDGLGHVRPKRILYIVVLDKVCLQVDVKLSFIESQVLARVWFVRLFSFIALLAV